MHATKAGLLYLSWSKVAVCGLATAVLSMRACQPRDFFSLSISCTAHPARKEGGEEARKEADVEGVSDKDGPRPFAGDTLLPCHHQKHNNVTQPVGSLEHGLVCSFCSCRYYFPFFCCFWSGLVWSGLSWSSLSWSKKETSISSLLPPLPLAPHPHPVINSRVLAPSPSLLPPFSRLPFLLAPTHLHCRRDCSPSS